MPKEDNLKETIYMNVRSLLTPALVLFAALAGSAISRADNIYTFNSLAGSLTPIGPAAPDIGNPSFTTTFSATGDPGGANVPSGGFPDTLIPGAFLVTNNNGPLTLTFNQPVYSLSVNFGLDAPVTDPLAYLELGVLSTTFDQYNQAAGGGPFADGILSYSSATPFTTVTLDAFTDPGSETLFAITNLDLTTTASPVPEPSYLPLAGVALAGLVALSQRSKWSPSSTSQRA